MNFSRIVQTPRGRGRSTHININSVIHLSSDEENSPSIFQRRRRRRSPTPPNEAGPSRRRASRRRRVLPEPASDDSVFDIPPNGQRYVSPIHSPDDLEDGQRYIYTPTPPLQQQQQPGQQLEQQQQPVQQQQQPEEDDWNAHEPHPAFDGRSAASFMNHQRLRAILRIFREEHAPLRRAENHPVGANLMMATRQLLAKAERFICEHLVLSFFVSFFVLFFIVICKCLIFSLCVVPIVFPADPVPLIQMDPELAMFLSHPLTLESFAAYDRMLILACQMTVQMLKLEQDLRSERERDLLLPAIAPRQPICMTCVEPIVPGFPLLASTCGHYLCRTCSIRMDGVFCAFCRGPWEPAFLRNINFRFNSRDSIICRACSIEFEENTEIRVLNCGDCFCRACSDRLVNYCVCGQPKIGDIRLLLNY